MTWQLAIENIGGIRSGTAVLKPGVNTVQASNWQGKSSLIKAVETVMGTRTPLTEGAATGRVELKSGQDTVTAELLRDEGRVVHRGDCYLAEERDRVCAALFAFLGEDNEVRQAVRAGENLEAVLTRPLEFERIDERITDLVRERDQVDAELDRARAAAQDLPGAQERVTTLEDRLAELRAEHEAVVTARPGGDDPAATRDALSSARAEYTGVEDRIDQLEATIHHARARLAERQGELEDHAGPAAGDLETELEETRGALHDIDRDIDLLQSVYTANKRVLDEGRVELVADVAHGLVTDEVDCWVCGHSGALAGIEEQLDGLAERLAARHDEVNELRDRVADLEAEQRARRERQRAEREVRAAITDLEQTIADRTASLEAARGRRADLEERIEALSAEVDATEERVTEVKSEIKYTEASLEDARAEVETLETRAAQREMLEADHAALTEDIDSLRTRKDTIKRDARHAFDQAIQHLITRLEPGFDGARLTPGFELVVARDGREASLDALSEGEVELLGLIAALAGYEAFEVSARVPVILLDGVGGFAGDNLETLVGYLAERADYLVTTAYPEQGGLAGHVVDPAEWTTVAEHPGSGAVSS